MEALEKTCMYCPYCVHISWTTLAFEIIGNINKDMFTLGKPHKPTDVCCGISTFAVSFAYCLVIIMHQLLPISIAFGFHLIVI